MKTNIIILFFLLMGFSVAAQDVITLRDGESIKAFVQEVGDFDIKYKKFDNPNGPIYTLKKADVFMISYPNGSKDVFSAPVVSTPSTTQVQTQSGELPRNLFRNDAQFENYLKMNHPELYTKFHKGQILSRTGKTLLTPGVVLMGSGLGLLIAGAVVADIDDYYTGESMMIAGGVVLSVGTSLTITSIPLSVVGNNLKRNVRNQFTRDYSGELRIQMSGNGLGLAYVF